MRTSGFIHGGLTTIGEMQGWVELLAKKRQVIAVEMQGHGRTADTDRPMTFVTMGDDVAALLDYLKIPKADSRPVQQQPRRPRRRRRRRNSSPLDRLIFSHDDAALRRTAYLLAGASACFCP